MCLRSVSLKPMYLGETFAHTNVVDINPSERKNSLKSTTDINFKDKMFQDWVAKYSLLIGVFGNKETTIMFGQRVYNTMCREFSFSSPAEHRVTEISRALKGDSAALSKVYTAVLRNSSIPCRVMYGRKSDPKVAGETVKWLNGENPQLEEEKLHAQAQFYCPTVGWIPVNITKGVQGMSAGWHEKNTETYYGGFGTDEPGMMTWSVDRQLVDLPVYGPKGDLNPQTFNLLFSHKRLASEWNVVEFL